MARSIDSSDILLDTHFEQKEGERDAPNRGKITAYFLAKY